MHQNEFKKIISDEMIIDIAHETLKTFSLTHNYNIWLINQLGPYIGKKTLEIGCGIGNLTFYLQHLTNLTCLDVSDFYIAHMRIDYPTIKFYRNDIADEKVRELKHAEFDTITCINVLEHIEDDKKALQNMFDILQPKGRVLLYVPALQFLYGSVDKTISHYRRYNKNQLEKLLNEVGFIIEKIFYTNIIGTLGWFVNSKIQRKKNLSYWQIIAFDKFVPIIEKIEKHMNLPFGMSLLAIARKCSDAY